MSQRVPPSPIVAILALSLALIVAAEPAMAIEEPAYTLVRQYPQFELRRYAPTLIAETKVSGDFDGVGNQAFRTLAGFIFGKNRTGESIAMTAPVNQRPATTTQPTASPDSGDYWLSFTMPRRFTSATLPAPTDPGIQVREEPARLMAARRYSGRWTLANYREQEAALLAAVRAAGLQATAPPVYARYNAPFVPWFMRRNEVLVQVRDEPPRPAATP